MRDHRKAVANIGLEIEHLTRSFLAVKTDISKQLPVPKLLFPLVMVGVFGNSHRDDSMRASAWLFSRLECEYLHGLVWKPTFLQFPSICLESFAKFHVLCILFR